MKHYLITGVSPRSKGGEAMVLVTYNLVKKIDPFNSVSLLTPTPDYDRLFIQKCTNIDITVIDANPMRKIKNKYLRAMLSFLIVARDLGIFLLNSSILDRFDHHKNYKSPFMSQCDANDSVLQIAGISFSRNFGRISAFGWFFQMITARMLGRCYYCLPQSIGPSDDWFINRCARLGLDRVTIIMPRGQRSMKYLQKIGVSNQHIQFVPDLAFSYPNPMPEDDKELYERYGFDPEKKYVGVLFNTHLFRWGGEEVLKIFSSIIDFLAKEHGYTVLLIAHEVLEEGGIDDRYVNAQLWDLSIEKDRIFEIKEDLRANEIKSLIRLCDFTICSRFHAMISSLKVGVPPLVVGWADKYLEIMEMFKLEYLVMDFNECSEYAMKQKIEYILANHSLVRSQVFTGLNKYENSSKRVEKILRETIG